jgi:hypothetical protein
LDSQPSQDTIDLVPNNLKATLDPTAQKQLMDLVSSAKRSKPNPASESPFRHSRKSPSPYIHPPSASHSNHSPSPAQVNHHGSQSPHLLHPPNLNPSPNSASSSPSSNSVSSFFCFFFFFFFFFIF